MATRNEPLGLWNRIIPELRRKIVPWALLSLWLSLPSWAQQNHIVVDKNKAQAVLHISAFIVPVASSLHSDSSQSTSTAVVTYDVPSQHVQMDVTEETHALPISIYAAGTQTRGGGVLMTRTIVLR